ncbi:MAG TPA: CoA-binding protein [Thermoanaerobaculia bacterium]
MTEKRTPRGRRLESEADLAAVVRSLRTIAVVGMKGEDQLDESAYSIPAMLQARGLRVIPVNPTIARSLGETAYPDLASVPEPFDVVDLFRRADAVPGHVEQILALPAARRPRVVWLQSGIRHDAATERLLAAGIDVVQDRCLGVYASRYAR